MTMKEAIQKRDALIAEERQIRQAIKILKSDSIPNNCGVEYAVISYEERLKAIDKEIRALANAVTEESKSHEGEFTVKFDFEGEAAYPVSALVNFCPDPKKDDVLTWDSKEEAEAFAKWYAGKYGYEVVPVSSLED